MNRLVYFYRDDNKETAIKVEEGDNLLSSADKTKLESVPTGAELDAMLALKQDKLSTTQLDTVNSGMTSSDKAKLDSMEIFTVTVSQNGDAVSDKTISEIEEAYCAGKLLMLKLDNYTLNGRTVSFSAHLDRVILNGFTEYISHTYVLNSSFVFTHVTVVFWNDGVSEQITIAES